MRRILIAYAILLGAAGCAEPPEPPAPASAPDRVEAPDPSLGAPRLGPGERFNACERIWCIRHEANFALDHFLEGHVGWILHDDRHGDVFAPRGRTQGPAMPGAHTAMVRSCGQHLHPWILERRRGPIRKGGWNAGLDYGRKHFQVFGTRLDPCCANGLAWGFLHASSPEQFRFHDVTLFRQAPGIGWQQVHRSSSPAR